MGKMCRVMTMKFSGLEDDQSRSSLFFQNFINLYLKNFVNRVIIDYVGQICVTALLEDDDYG